MKLRGLVSLILAATVLAACGTASKPSGQPGGANPAPGSSLKQLVIAGGTQGGVYYILQSALAKLLEPELTGVPISVVSSNTVEAAVGLHTGRYDLVMSQTDIAYCAYTASCQGFKEKAEEVRFIAAGYMNAAVFVVPAKSAIRKMSDIKPGTRIGTQSPSTIQEFTDMLKHQGVSDPKLVPLPSFDAIADAIKQGSIQVGIYISAHPASALQQLSADQEVRAVGWDQAGIDKFLAQYPFWSKATVKAGTYPWLKEDNSNVGRPLIVLVRADMPESAVYSIVKSIYTQTDKLIQVHPLAAHFTLANAQSMLAAGTVKVPVHPGAAKFFKEQGLDLSGVTVK